jgi:hypothetical protein
MLISRKRPAAGMLQATGGKNFMRMGVLERFRAKWMAGSREENASNQKLEPRF